MNFKKILLMAALFSCTAAFADDWGFIGRYDNDNKELMAQPNNGRRVVFIGNSITDNWAAMRPDFFKNNDFIGRGIGGQTSYQFIVRFREDVVNLKPKAVVINVATNDVAENTCPYDEDKTFGNIETMVELARANGIKVILTSTLPSAGFLWNPSIQDAPEKIAALNARIKAYAKANKIPFVDYYSQMEYGDNHALNPALSPDGVHPNDAGYEVMEAMILPVVRKLVK